MKILILTNKVSGLIHFRKELLIELVRNNTVYISSPNGDLIRELIGLGCIFLETEFNRRGTNVVEDINLLRKYRLLIKDLSPDVILSYTIKPNIYGGMAAASMGVPYIANITGLGTAVENGGAMQKLTLMLYKYAFRKINCVFVQNEGNKQFFIDHRIAADKLRLLPGSGVNLEKFKVLPYPNDDTIEFVFISRIMKEKGIDQYLEAAEFLRRKYPNTRFHVCGACEEDYTERLNEMQKKGIIIYHGLVNDVTKVLRVCHCTVHPTYYPEGMSNVLLESCASGRPIITTDRSGCREVVEDDVNGYIIKQCDSEDLIAKIEQFISLSLKERKEMGLNGRKKVEREFDRQIVVDAYMQELEKIMDR